jgi:hypothetical protein
VGACWDSVYKALANAQQLLFDVLIGRINTLQLLLLLVLPNLLFLGDRSRFLGVVDLFGAFGLGLGVDDNVLVGLESAGELKQARQK